MAGGRDYDARKLRELVLFVARQCESDRTFGSVKLNKILYFADSEAYVRLGQSITGARYQHLPEGPALAAMIDGFEGPKHRRAIALRDPDLAGFSADEIAAVTEWIVTFWGMSARDVSDYSHETVAWRITRDRQEIPYGAALLPSDEPTDDELTWATEVAASYGLLATT